MTISTHHIFGGTCTLHGAHAGMHCPTCVTILPPLSLTGVVYPADNDEPQTYATAPTTPTIE